MMKEKPRKCIFQVDHIFKISTRSYMFRHLRCAIFRKPKVILPKLCVCYVLSTEYVKVVSGYHQALSVEGPGCEVLVMFGHYKFSRLCTVTI
jgi:hypothetical protein